MIGADKKEHDGRVDLMMERLMIENKQKWREEMKDMPFIQFPASWKVQVIPPFGDAVVRFRVQLPSGRIKSIYLDSRNSLGFWWDDAHGPRAYWEVYPVQGDTARCEKENIKELLEFIADESEPSDDD